jgi:hypothetical protein
MFGSPYAGAGAPPPMYGSPYAPQPGGHPGYGAAAGPPPGYGVAAARREAPCWWEWRQRPPPAHWGALAPFGPGRSTSLTGGCGHGVGPVAALRLQPCGYSPAIRALRLQPWGGPWGRILWKHSVP